MSKWCHPVVVQAFFVAPFFRASRRRAAEDIWGSSTLAQWRDKDIEGLSRDDAALEGTLQRDVASFLSYADALGAAGRSTSHPSAWRRMYGDQWPKVQAIATRLLQLRCSSTGNARSFKTLANVLSRSRNRLLTNNVDKQWSVRFNSKQLGRPEILHACQR